MSAPTRTNIGAVIVTFHPDPGIRERVLAVSFHVHTVIVVDNGSSPAELSGIKQNLPENVLLIENSLNLGVAAALNIGADALMKKREIAFAFLLDQDSVIPGTVFTELENAWNQLPDASKVGVIGCNYVDTNIEPPRERYAARGSANAILETTTVISSGSLIPMRVFEAIGTFETGLFIDHVDNEFCLRARARGYKVFVALKAVFQHRIGDAQKRRLFWAVVYPMHQSEFRLFYVSRNTLVISARYLFREPAWACDALGASLKRFIKMLLYEQKRTKKAAAAFKGAAMALPYLVSGCCACKTD